MTTQPLVSIVIPTYNRAGTLGRALDSVLAQTYTNFEIIIVDDGSTDGTSDLLKKYADPRIRVIRHVKNRGVTAAKNTGLDQIKGDWFCTLDSDNEIIPETLEEMLRIPLEMDPQIEGVVCNCIDSVTKQFTGQKLTRDGYLDFATRMNAQGEFWGITKTSVLGKERFNENLPGYENTLWYKIYEKSLRYYVHKGYQIYHTEGDDRITVSTKSLQRWNQIFEGFSKESDYLRILKQYRLDEYANRCFQGVIFNKAYGNHEISAFWKQELNHLRGFGKKKMIANTVHNFVPPAVIRTCYNAVTGIVKLLKKA